MEDIKKIVGNDDLVGKTFTHPEYGDYTVMDEYKIDKSSRHKKYKIIFKNTGTIDYKFKANIISGKVKDAYTKDSNGKCFGDPYKYGFDSKNRNDARIYANWNNLFNSVDNKLIDISWYCFENFYRDYINLEGYEEWISGKDMEISSDCDYYSFKTCRLTATDSRLIKMNKARQANTKVPEYYGVEKISDNRYLVRFQKNSRAIMPEVRFDDPYYAAIYREYTARAMYMPAMNNVPVDDKSYMEALKHRTTNNPPKQLYRIIDKNKEDA